jgi:hypothetical protein
MKIAQGFSLGFHAEKESSPAGAKEILRTDRLSPLRGLVCFETKTHG